MPMLVAVHVPPIDESMVSHAVNAIESGLLDPHEAAKLLAEDLVEKAEIEVMEIADAD